MTTIGQFNTKNPTIKRILKEARELSTSPSPDYHAAPLESNLFEWHFTVRGPPSPSPYANGIYHGRIVLPNSYPLRPPSFRFTTPSGRFEVNREICLSISGHHEETWQPAWGIRTALVAIRSFMDSDAKGQLGGLDASEAVRARLANESRAWKCLTCGGKTNDEIIKEREVESAAAGASAKPDDAIPEELRLGYRDELGKSKDDAADVSTGTVPLDTTSVSNPPTLDSQTAPEPPSEASAGATITSSATVAQQRSRTTSQPRLANRSSPRSTTSKIDTAIWVVAIALVLMLVQKYASMT